jgi:hypothetical protein
VCGERACRHAIGLYQRFNGNTVDSLLSAGAESAKIAGIDGVICPGAEQIGRIHRHLQLVGDTAKRRCP